VNHLHKVITETQWPWLIMSMDATVGIAWVADDGAMDPLAALDGSRRSRGIFIAPTVVCGHPAIRASDRWAIVAASPHLSDPRRDPNCGRTTLISGLVRAPGKWMGAADDRHWHHRATRAGSGELHDGKVGAARHRLRLRIAYWAAWTPLVRTGLTAIAFVCVRRAQHRQSGSAFIAGRESPTSNKCVIASALQVGAIR
jgi:hypothetical protein